MWNKVTPVLVLWLLVPLVAWGVLQLSQQRTVPTWSFARPAACQPSGSRMWLNGRESTSSRGEYTLAFNGVISQQVCYAGGLQFTARGTAAEGLFPLMTVSINGKSLLTTRVSDAKLFTVDIPQAGEIVVAFHDDRYLPDHQPPEDRNLFISEWRFEPGD